MSGENLSRPSRRGFTGPCMAHTNMVPSSSTDADSATQVVVVDPSSGVNETHPLGKVYSIQAKLKLMACPLSGNIIGARTFLTTLGYLVMWNLFCRERKILAHYHTLNHVLESLYTQLHLSYSSINSTMQISVIMFYFYCMVTSQWGNTH
jgi:hypothetical protein